MNFDHCETKYQNILFVISKDKEISFSIKLFKKNVGKFSESFQNIMSINSLEWDNYEIKIIILTSICRYVRKINFIWEFYIGLYLVAIWRKRRKFENMEVKLFSQLKWSLEAFIPSNSSFNWIWWIIQRKSFECSVCWDYFSNFDKK